MWLADYMTLPLGGSGLHNELTDCLDHFANQIIEDGERIEDGRRENKRM